MYLSIKIGKLRVFFFLYERDALCPTDLIGGGITWGSYDLSIVGETPEGV